MKEVLRSEETRGWEKESWVVRRQSGHGQLVGRRENGQRQERKLTVVGKEANVHEDGLVGFLGELEGCRVKRLPCN